MKLQFEASSRSVRPDGAEKVTGSGRYTADLTPAGCVHAKLRYADHPHARVCRIDTARARSMPGVLAVLTHEDVPDVGKYGGAVQDRRLFARERVRWEGDVVAAVAALTPKLAAEAAARIDVEYEPLPANTDPSRADEGVLIHEDWAENIGNETRVATGTPSVIRRSSRETPTPRWTRRTSW